MEDEVREVMGTHDKGHCGPLYRLGFYLQESREPW